VSVLFGAPVERRSWGSVPPIPRNSEGSGGSFARVDLGTAEASLQKVAIWACVTLIRQIAEMLPLDAFEGEGPTAKPVDVPDYLLNLGGDMGPNADGGGLPDWCSQVVYSEMLRGNAIGVVVERDQRTALPTQVVLQHPDAVAVTELPGRPVEWRIDGKVVDRSRIWHHRINSVPGRTLGMSPVAMEALTIGLGIAATRFGAQWFEDGAHPSGLLVSQSPLGQTAAKTAKQRFMDALRGTREPIVLGQGWKYQAIQIAPGESQFLETNQYTSAECCRIFGPALAEFFGYETGGSLTYANVQERSIDLLTYAVDPYLVRLERMLTALAPGSMYLRFNRGALLRTDLLTRYRAHALALQNRFKVVNEVRADEDMTPVGWGQEPFPIKAAAGPDPINPGASDSGSTPPSEGRQG